MTDHSEDIKAASVPTFTIRNLKISNEIFEGMLKEIYERLDKLEYNLKIHLHIP